MIIKKMLTLIFLCFLLVDMQAQYFEGSVVYENVYKSKLNGVTDEQLSGMMGATSFQLETQEGVSISE
jgi:hypothetical protein